MTDVTQFGGNLPAEQQGSWGSEGASQNDVLIPRLMLMQDLSELVKQRRADSGDYVHSGTGEVLIPKGQKAEFIPIVTYRDWLIQDRTNSGQWQPRKKGGIIRMTPENENWPVEAVENGQPIKRVKSINFFVLFVPRIDELPFLVSFRKAGIQAGKQLTTDFKVAQMKKVPPASKVYTLSSTQRTWDGYTFGVGVVEPSRPSTPEELAIARKWYEVLNQESVAVADEFAAESDESFAFGQ